MRNIARILTGLSVTAFLCQVAQAQPTLFTGTLTGSQQVPANPSTGTGNATVHLVDSDGNGTLDAIDINLFVTGLSGTITDAHIHQEAPGVNGQVRVQLFHDENDNLMGTITEAGHGYTLNTRLFSSATSTPLATTIQNFQDGLPYYVNVHTSTSLSGEIRADLTGAAAAPEPGSLTLFAGLLPLGMIYLRRRSR